MNPRKLPPFILAVFLQFAPVVKLFQANPLMTGSSPLAIVLRWAVSVAAVVGAYHTVTGASAAVAGLIKMTNSPTGPKSAGPLTNNAVASAGQPFFFRILVTNPGSDHAQDFWDVRPRPPGITINTNYGGNGFITNTPGQLTVAGVYPVTLVAGNQNCDCEVTLPATITIAGGGASPPGITKAPTNLTVTAGQNAVFAVTATGTAPLAYQWRFNGTNLLGQVSSNLSLVNVSLSQAGPYDVVVTNGAGSITSAPPAVLTINPSGSSPIITNQPSSRTVLVGSNAVFAVGASGTAPLSYRWLKGLSAINGATNLSLTITNTQDTDAASYSVQVSNSAGTNTSLPAVLTVVGPALLTVAAQPAGQVVLSFNSLPTVGYALEYAAALPPVAWSTFTNFPPASTAIDRTVVDPATNVTRYYRLNMSLP